MSHSSSLSSLSLFLFAVCFFFVIPGECNDRVLMNRYAMTDVKGDEHYFYGVDGTVPDGYGAIAGGAMGYVLSVDQQNVDFVPLYRFYNAANTNYYLTRWDDVIDTSGYVFDAIVGYVSDVPVDGMVPYYRWYNPTSRDHYYTTDADEEPAGYRGGAVGGYIFPPYATTSRPTPKQTERPTNAAVVATLRPTNSPRPTNAVTGRPTNTARPTDTDRPTRDLSARSVFTPQVPGGNGQAPGQAPGGISTTSPMIDTDVIVLCLVAVNALFVVAMIGICWYARSTYVLQQQQRVKYEKVMDTSSAGQTSSDSSAVEIEHPRVVYE